MPKHDQAKVDRRKFLTGVAVAGAASAVTAPPASAAAPAAAAASAAAVRAAAIRGGGRGRDRNPEGACARHAAGRLRLHGRRHQDAGHRVLPVQRRIELPRPARVDDQLRPQQEAGIPHLYARGMRGRHGPWLLQGRRQADDDARPRDRRPAARLDGDLQCVVRPGAGDRRRRQPPGSLQASARRADVPRRAGHQCAGARLHQVGRRADLAAALRAVVRARLQDRDGAALRAGGDRARCRPAAGADQERRDPGDPALRADLAAAGRFGAVREAARLLANAERPVIVVDRAARTREGNRAPGRARRNPAGAGGRPGRADELPQHASPQPPGRRDRPGRRHHRDGAVRLLGDRERLGRQRRSRPRHQRVDASSPAPS